MELIIKKKLIEDFIDLSQFGAFSRKVKDDSIDIKFHDYLIKLFDNGTLELFILSELKMKTSDLIELFTVILEHRNIMILSELKKSEKYLMKNQHYIEMSENA